MAFDFRSLYLRVFSLSSSPREIERKHVVHFLLLKIEWHGSQKAFCSHIWRTRTFACASIMCTFKNAIHDCNIACAATGSVASPCLFHSWNMASFKKECYFKWISFDIRVMNSSNFTIRISITKRVFVCVDFLFFFLFIFESSVFVTAVIAVAIVLKAHKLRNLSCW